MDRDVEVVVPERIFQLSVALLSLSLTTTAPPYTIAGTWLVS